MPGNEPARGVRIGSSDVEWFRATVDMFAKLDDRYGGGHARSALTQYLSTDAERMLNGRYSDETGRALVTPECRWAQPISYPACSRPVSPRGNKTRRAGGRPIGGGPRRMAKTAPDDGLPRDRLCPYSEGSVPSIRGWP
jgi:hypothetical protein